MSAANDALLQFLSPTQPVPAAVITPVHVEGVPEPLYCRQIPLAESVALFKPEVIALGAPWGVKVLAAALVKPDGTPLRTAAEWDIFISLGHHGMVKKILTAVMPIIGASVATDEGAAVDLGNASTPTA